MLWEMIIGYNYIMNVDDIEKLAKAIYEDYVKNMIASGNVNALSAVLWKKLPDEFKESNRNAARSFKEKLNSVGYDIASADSRYPAAGCFDEAIILKLAKAEHDRWMNEKLANGWIYAPIRDNAKKHHPMLIPYEELPLEEQKKDICVVSKIIPLLKGVGLRVYKMRHDVFISYSTKDKLIADAICLALERDGIRCWIAPRDADVHAGAIYGEFLVGAIQQCSICLLLFSENSNASGDVASEIYHAFAFGKVIIAYHLDNAEMSDALAYILKFKHWLNAIPNETRFENLVTSIQKALALSKEKFENPPEKFGAVEASWAISRASNPEEKPKVLRMLGKAASLNKDPTHRYWIYVALGEIGGEEARLLLQQKELCETNLFAKKGLEDAKEIMRKKENLRLPVCDRCTTV
jgi:RyR domain.